MLTEPQSRGFAQTPALVFGEQRLRTRSGGEDALLKAAEEQRPHAPRAQRERVEHSHRAGPRTLTATELQTAKHARQGTCVLGREPRV